jgi:transporter family protein
MLWALASVLLAVGARRLHVLPLNLVRCMVSTTFFWVLLPFFGGWQAVVAIPPSAWVWLVVSVLGLLVIGDTLYFRSLDLAGVSWAMPVAGVNPLWAVLLGALFLDEPLTWTLLASALLVVAGITLVGRSSGARNNAPSSGSRQPHSAGTPGPGPLRLQAASGPVSRERARSPGERRTGLLLALAVSVLWAVGLLALKPATADIDAVVANSVRQPLAMLMLVGLAMAQGRWRELKGLDRRSWAVIVGASLLGTGLATLFFVWAIQRAGAGRTAILTSTSPILAIPFSMLWLGERPGRLTLAGMVLTTVGIALVA